ncbi:histidine phosphatase family protein [Marinomonas dokdonensis]|uniref:histidine phosphatase family protein n=1 Tax=Marinomonas dokdonensis TaxID=328224 RepID=UPI0040553B11
MKLIEKPFVFVRHGQTKLNAAGLIGGRTDSPLTSLGIEQAKQGAKQLNVAWSAVYASGLSRAQDTARYAVPKQEFIVHEGLNERDWGDLEECPIAQLTPYEETPPNGEAWADFEARVIGALNDILAQHEWPLIVAHSGVHRVLNNHINGTPYGERIDNVAAKAFEPVSLEDNTPAIWLISPYEGQNL